MPWLACTRARAPGRQQEDAIVPSDNPVCRTTKWILRVHEKYRADIAIVFDTWAESRVHRFYMDALHPHLPRPSVMRRTSGTRSRVALVKPMKTKEETKLIYLPRQRCCFYFCFFFPSRRTPCALPSSPEMASNSISSTFFARNVSKASS